MHHSSRLYRASRSIVSSAVQPPGWRGGAAPGGSYTGAAGERPPRARPWRRGSPGPIPNPEVKPAIAESTAASGCGRVGRRARGGRFSLFRAAHRARPTSRRVPRGALFSFSGTEARCHPHRRTAIFGGRAAGLQAGALGDRRRPYRSAARCCPQKGTYRFPSKEKMLQRKGIIETYIISYERGGAVCERKDTGSKRGCRGGAR